MDSQWWKTRLLRLNAYLRSTLEVDPPRQLALVVALGAFLGLLPLGNIVGLALLTLLVLHPRLNAGVGILAATGFALLGMWWEPFLHRTGYLVLTWAPITPLWAALCDFPLAAWTGFNNTLVMGAWVTGLYMFTPVYLLTLWLLDRYRAKLIWLVKHHRWSAWIWNSSFARKGETA